MSSDRSGSSTGRAVIFIITLIAVALIIFALYLALLPRIRHTIEKSDIIALTSADAGTTIRPIWLFESASDTVGTVFNMGVKKTGETSLHDSIEALFSVHNTPGFTTYIPPHARLLGLTSVDGWCFISLSDELDSLSASDFNLAALQIRNTILLADSTIKHIKLLSRTEHTIL